MQIPCSEGTAVSNATGAMLRSLQHFLEIIAYVPQNQPLGEEIPVQVEC